MGSGHRADCPFSINPSRPGSDHAESDGSGLLATAGQAMLAVCTQVESAGIAEKDASPRGTAQRRTTAGRGVARHRRGPRARIQGSNRFGQTPLRLFIGKLPNAAPSPWTIPKDPQSARREPGTGSPPVGQRSRTQGRGRPQSRAGVDGCKRRSKGLVQSWDSPSSWRQRCRPALETILRADLESQESAWGCRLRKPFRSSRASCRPEDGRSLGINGPPKHPIRMISSGHTR